MMDLSETIEVCDMKVDIYNKLKVNLMSTWTYTCTGDQDHSLTYVQGHSDFVNLKRFCPKATGQTDIKLHIEPS